MSPAMICPQCGKLISTEERNCPFCGAWNPSLYGAAPKLQRLFGNRLDLTRLIIVGCIALYVTSLALQPSAIFQMRGIFDILAPGNRPLYQLGMTSGALLREGWWWTLFTAVFLHGSLLHIVFNLLWVRDLGPMVTEVYGPARAFVIFMVAGAIGFLVSDLMGASPSIGASGAIFGLLAALIVYGRRHGGAALTARLWQWAIILFVMGLFVRSVNNWAHAGGFAGGWLAAQAMHLGHEKRESAWVQLLALALILVTAVGIALSLVKVTRLTGVLIGA